MRLERLITRLRRHFNTSAPLGGVVYITTETTTVTERPAKRQSGEPGRSANGGAAGELEEPAGRPVVL